MPIYKLEKLDEDDMSRAKLVIAQETNLELEEYLEDWLENSPWVLIENSILWIGRQTSATDKDGTIFSDLFGVDSEGNLVIAELKKGRTPRDIIAQILDYAAWADDLSDSQIRDIAETYFENREGFQEKTFDDAFREAFDIPETDELPRLNDGGLRLFIVAEEIPSRVARVCRFLRSSHGINVSCVDISIFQTESHEVVVSTETTVGDEDFAAPNAQQQGTSPPSRWSGDKPAREVVWDAVQKFTHGKTEIEFTIKVILALIRENNSDFKRPTMDGIMIADTVNHPSRHHSRSAKYDCYWQVDRGKYRLYDSEKDKVESDRETNQ